MTGAAAGKPGKPGVRWTQCVCTEQIETTMQTLTFSGVLHCPETDIKMTRHDNGFVKEGAELFSLLHRLRVPFLALFFLFLTARPIGVQPPPQLLHFRYPNHQRQIDTGVCV